MDASANVVAFRPARTSNPLRRTETKAGEARPIRDVVPSANTSPRCKVQSLRMWLTRLAAIVSWLKEILERRRSHRALMELTDTQLQDIGLSRVAIVDRPGGQVHLRLVPADDR
ncbi:DUF1127 domain-containing protein [Mesorhizobium sp.]|uniref:DUF1127 domain-containing protein n=1 Tax=Mesorhizobium sp. TaxID=1871066 RepID=UPI00345485CD